MLKPDRNLLLEPAIARGDLTDLTAPTVHRRAVALKKREIRDLRNRANARQAIAGLTKDVELFGFTKGRTSPSPTIHTWLSS